MLQTTSPITLPCGKNCENDCEIRNKMIALERVLVTPPEDGAAELVQTFFNSYQELLQTSEDQARSFPPEIALPALFDFVVSAKYVERMLANEGWTYCSGSNSTESPALFFPFIKTCPRCSAAAPTATGLAHQQESPVSFAEYLNCDFPIIPRVYISIRSGSLKRP